MKFTKLTSSVLAGATLVSMLAPTASFAATESGNAVANGGVALPQTDKTDVGISFGDNSHTGNNGYLRLQMVPHVLDFGNHELLDASYPVFSADGTNDNLNTNNRHVNYEGKDTNMTAVLNTTDSDLSAVKGKAWATVVDKQVTRDASTVTAPNTSASGDWKLSVKADNALAAVDSQGNRTADVIDDATLSFANTSSAQTSKVFELTNETQDSSWTADLAGLTTPETAKKVGSITNKFSLDLSDTTTNQNSVDVAKAATGEGQGADVFGWAKQDIKLTMPVGAQVNNSIYKANLTWTLASTI